MSRAQPALTKIPNLYPGPDKCGTQHAPSYSLQGESLSNDVASLYPTGALNSDHKRWYDVVFGLYVSVTSGC